MKTTRDSALYFVERLFPTHRGDLISLLRVLPHELVPDPSAEQVSDMLHLVRDAKDVPVALAAIAAEANYLISTDADFTDLDSTTEELRRQVQPVQPGRFLRDVMGWSSEQSSMAWWTSQSIRP